ncbi:MAG TPA: hypothetical protein DDZ44_11450 [Syntrophomonas wolfei]|uniref:Uncharacterized protein n=1 Tax=Syntrophomonas wolfei TaxID=863 RepID=A0A354YYW8_9FIRM|nr:hypothetical protein [Syntrophomonas wolfei]HBK54540.1 hypothetical protein [Syntrophomonas wolfei]
MHISADYVTRQERATETFLAVFHILELYTVGKLLEQLPLESAGEKSAQVVAEVYLLNRISQPGFSGELALCGEVKSLKEIPS